MHVVENVTRLKNYNLASHDPKPRGFMESLGAYNLGAYSLGLPILDLRPHLLDWGPAVWGVTVWGLQSRVTDFGSADPRIYGLHRLGWGPTV